MRTATIISVLVVGGCPVAFAQAQPRVSVQAGFGVAFRGESPYIAGSTGGIHAAARLGIPIHRSLRLIGELSLTRYGNETFALPYLCPQPGLCPRAITSLPGLGAAGFGVGLQPELGHGPVRLLMTGTAGGYWLYNRTPALPSATMGLQGSVGLSLEVDPRVRVTMEGGDLFLLHGRAESANTRHIGLGVILQ